MAGRGLGSLTLDLILKIGGFEQGWDRAARITNKRANEIEKRAHALGRGIGSALKSAAGGLLAFTGVSLSVAAAVDSIKSAIDRADNIRDLSIRLGVGTETLSAFGYAATQTGTDIEELNKGLLILSKNVAAAMDPKSAKAGLFKALGVDVKDAQGNLRSLDQLIPDIADKFKLLEDGTTKTAIALQLFGRSGASLIEFFNQGSDGLKTMADRARELGITIKDNTAEAADKFNDTLADLKAATGGLALQVAEALFPQLQKVLEWAVEFVSDGDNAAKIADSIATNLETVADAIVAIRDTFGVLSDLRDWLGESDRAAQSLLGNLGANSAVSSFLKNQFPSLYEPIIGGPKRQKPSTSEVPDWLKIDALNGQQPFRATTPVLTPLIGSAERQQAMQAAKEQAKVESDVRKYLAGQDKETKGTKKSGKSDREKELERMRKDAEDAREELEKLVKQEAEAREAFEAMAASLAGPLADANYQFIKDQERLNELAKEGAIGAKELETAQTNLRIAHEKNVEAINAQLTPSQEVIAGLREEIELIGLSDIAQQKLIATKQAGKEATEEEIAEIERLIDAREQANKAADLQREVEAGLADAIYDVASGAKSAGDAIKDFFDDLAKYILRMIAENWAKQIAGLFTGGTGASASGGASGTNWIGLIAGIFGGGKASGGTAWPNSMYQVNERGFEMATVGGNDYMLTGRQPVKITPNHQLQGGGLVQNIQFNVQGRVSDETRSQAAAKVAYATQLVTARNGR